MTHSEPSAGSISHQQQPLETPEEDELEEEELLEVTQASVGSLDLQDTIPPVMVQQFKVLFLHSIKSPLH